MKYRFSLLTPRLLLLFLCLAASSCITQAKEPVLESLGILTADGRNITYKIETAATEMTMRRGLMFRDSMADDHGMLFIYQPQRDVSMWMKNTILSLDMLFIDGAGKIVYIEERTTPFSLETISAGRPVRAVLEINAGQVDHHGIQPGDIVVHPAFQ